jgi:hypothetical protein
VSKKALNAECRDAHHIPFILLPLKALAAHFIYDFISPDRLMHDNLKGSLRGFISWPSYNPWACTIKLFMAVIYGF